MLVPSLLITKNAVEFAFQAARCALDGTRYERFTKPGLVDPSVMRTMREPKVGSLNEKPALPICGSAGLVRTRRSVMAEYCEGTPDVCACAVVNDQTGPAVVPV